MNFDVYRLQAAFNKFEQARDFYSSRIKMGYGSPCPGLWMRVRNAHFDHSRLIVNVIANTISERRRSFRARDLKAIDRSLKRLRDMQQLAMRLDSPTDPSGLNRIQSA